MNGRISANFPKLAKHRLLIRARGTDFGKSTPGVCTASAQNLSLEFALLSEFDGENDTCRGCVH